MPEPDADYWRKVDRAAQTVASWPEWMQGPLTPKEEKKMPEPDAALSAALEFNQHGEFVDNFGATTGCHCPQCQAVASLITAQRQSAEDERTREAAHAVCQLCKLGYAVDEFGHHIVGEEPRAYPECKAWRIRRRWPSAFEERT